MGGYRSWSVAVNVDDPEGRSIWETSPYAPGTEVYLHVLQLPAASIVWGNDENRVTLNGELLELGPVPPRTGAWPLTVGCQLNIIPAWITDDPVEVAASQPNPVDGDRSGISLHRRNLKDLRIFAKSLASTPDAFSIQCWLQDSQGRWSRAPDYGGILPPPVTADTFLLDVQDAERVYPQIVFSGAPTDVVAIHYGKLTAPARAQVVLFGAIVAPLDEQQTNIVPRTEASLDVFQDF